MNGTTPKPGANGTRSNGGVRWAGFALTVLIAVLAFAAQWGVVNAKLSMIQADVTDMTREIQSLRSSLSSVEQRQSYLEGKLEGGEKP